MAFTLPKFVLRFLFGKASRPSGDYETLVRKYQGKQLDHLDSSSILIHMALGDYVFVREYQEYAQNHLDRCKEGLRLDRPCLSVEVH